MTRQRANGPGLNRAVARALPVSLEIRALASEENVTVSSGGTTAYYVSPCHRSDPIGCCLDEKWWDKSGGPLADGSRRENTVTKSEVMKELKANGTAQNRKVYARHAGG